MNKLNIFYKVILTQSANSISEKFIPYKFDDENDTFIQRRIKAIDCINNTWKTFKESNSPYTELKIELIFFSSNEEKLITDVTINTHGIKANTETLDIVYNNLTSEYQLFNKHNLDTSNLFRMSDYRPDKYGAILFVKLNS